MARLTSVRPGPCGRPGQAPAAYPDCAAKKPPCWVEVSVEDYARLERGNLASVPDTSWKAPVPGRRGATQRPAPRPPARCADLHPATAHRGRDQGIPQPAEGGPRGRDRGGVEDAGHAESVQRRQAFHRSGRCSPRTATAPGACASTACPPVSSRTPGCAWRVTTGQARTRPGLVGARPTPTHDVAVGDPRSDASPHAASVGTVTRPTAVPRNKRAPAHREIRTAMDVTV